MHPTACAASSISSRLAALARSRHGSRGAMCPAIVHEHDRARPRGDLGRCVRDRHQRRVQRLDVDQDRFRADVEDGVDVATKVSDGTRTSSPRPIAQRLERPGAGQRCRS